MNKNNYDILDLTKFVLSIMVVAIHTQLLLPILYPWLRLAVPLFFTISSFLLFSKINNNSKKGGKQPKQIIKNFCSRQAKLYLFWFIVLLPITIHIRSDWIIPKRPYIIYVYNILKHIFFNSTFAASWFIPANVIATIIIYKLSKKINYRLLLISFTIIYFLCCFGSYFTGVVFLKKITIIYDQIFSSPLMSFPVALIWVFIGKMFADNTINIKIINRKPYCLFLFFSMVLLFIECKIFSNRCYIFSLPVVILIFKLLLNTNISLKNAKLLRTTSTITYPLHASIAVVIRSILRRITSNLNLINIISFFTTLLLCYIACFVILKLEKKKYFKFLQYSH